MTLTSIGDLAQNFALRGRNTDLKQTLMRLGNEVSSGRVTDPVNRLDGHFAYLSQIEHDLVMAASFGTGAKEVQISASAMQNALGRISEESDSLVGTLVLATTAAGTTEISVVAGDARGALDAIVSALNTNVAGRNVFSGVSVTENPIASADDLLSGLQAVMAAALTPADALAAAEAFFDPGGGFETGIYQGSADSLAPVQLGAGESANLDLRADHQAFRDTLRHVAVAALADDPGLALNDTGRQALFGDVLDGLLSAKEDQVSMQADLGFAEERIERANSRIEAEIASLRLARNDLLEVDPYEAATELEAVQLQLETLYAVTARLSRLSLVNYL